MVDREARDKVAGALRAYMAEEIGASEFDDRISEVHDSKTGDRTAVSVVVELWGYYDDLKDHKIVADKQDWDCFNRLLLVLESDAEFEETRGSLRWGPVQAVAAVSLAVFAFTLARIGFRHELYWWTGALGLLWLLLQKVEGSGLSRQEETTFPFESVQILMRVRRSVPAFERRRYPGHLRRRSIRGPIASAAMWIPWVAALPWLSPLLLLAEAWPTRDRRAAIRSSR
jgi:hypothetical protein